MAYAEIFCRNNESYMCCFTVCNATSMYRYPLLFQYFNIYLLGIAVNSWETAIFVMIAGFILIWIHNLIGNCLVRMIGMYTRSMFKAIKE